MFSYLKWDNIKWFNIYAVGAPEEEEREWGRRNIRRTNGWEFSKIRDRHQTTNPKAQKHQAENENITPRYIIFKLLKIKDEKEMLKAAREKRHMTYPGEDRRLSKSSQKHHSSAPLEGHQSKIIKKKKKPELTSPNLEHLFCSNLKTYSNMPFEHIREAPYSK